MIVKTLGRNFLLSKPYSADVAPGPLDGASSGVALLIIAIIAVAFACYSVIKAIMKK
jgi:hypothetical protein